MKPVCLVIGAGAGIGGNTGKRFAQEGYHAVLCRRSDKEGLDRLVGDIQSEGGSASGLLLSAIEPDAIEDCIANVEAEIGPIEVVLFNLGAQIGDRALRTPATRPSSWAGVSPPSGCFASRPPSAR
jgi:NAD(P)-dependent dehydrogenase (short-subunit alcohol dehydrogenase family)